MKNIFDVDKNMVRPAFEPDELQWISPFDSKKINLCGSSVLSEKKFQRLSQAEQKTMFPLNDGVSWLATHSAGMLMKFETDSLNIALKVVLATKANMSHMTAVAQCSFDLYVYDESMKQYVLHTAGTYDMSQPKYTYQFSCFLSRKPRKYLMHFPLYNHVESCELGLDRDAIIKPVYFSNKKKIVIYGTSIAQGGCVSRPGLLASNMISRWCDTEVLNYGFSGAALAEPILGTIIGQRQDQEIFIIDCEANAGCTDSMEKNLAAFIDNYRVLNKDVPIIVTNRILFAMDLYDEKRISMRKYYKEFLIKLVNSYQEQGVKMSFVDAQEWFSAYGGNFTEYTVDGIHPTDFGNYEIAKGYYQEIVKVLNK